MINYNPETYCSLAFVGFDSRVQRTCCLIKFPKQFNSFKELSNDPDTKQLQEDLINGVKNSMCQQCWTYEGLGETSMRMGHLHHKTDETIQKEIQEKKLKHLVIDSGNVCNLACRTCSPESSSSLIKEFEAKRHQFGKNTWFLNSIKKTNLDYLMSEDYSQLAEISILGGEPFQNLEHLEVLRTIINQGYANNCTLSYSTNGTVPISKKIKDILIEFKSVHISLSIDAIGLPFEYIRTNGKWNLLLENFKDLVNLVKHNSNIVLRAHPTISALNVLYLDELFQWFDDNRLSHTIIFCETPQAYSFRIFDNAQKESIINQLKNSKFNMESIIQHINDCDFDPQALADFKQEIQFTKEFKNLDITEYLPKLRPPAQIRRY